MSIVPPSFLVDAPAEITWEGQRWLYIDHPPSKRRGVAQSRIWQYGYDYILATNPEMHAWRCGICIHNHLYLFKQDATSNCRKHLIRVHHVDTDSSTPAKRLREEVEVEGGSSEGSYTPMIRGLIQTVNIDEFRFHLIRWIVERHIPFTVVEDSNFQMMLKSLNSTVKEHIVKCGDTVRNWIEDEFIDAQVIIREEVLKKAISKIHISCDLWSSPNGYAICGIAAHFIGHQGRIQNVLLGLKRMRAAHGGKQIAEVIINVLQSYDITHKLGVFVADNADSNDTAWKEVLHILHPQRDPLASRSRCLGHIINLAAKAFLFGKNTEAFESSVNLVNDLTPQESEVMRRAQQAWRKQGPIGKMHNIITFIRASSQRKELFKRQVVSDKTDGKCIYQNVKFDTEKTQPHHVIRLCENTVSDWLVKC
jgi:hypothetical protein